MWFGNWAEIGRVVITGVIGFATLLLLIRLGGNRSLTKMNASDFIVTIAVGSTLSGMNCR